VHEGAILRSRKDFSAAEGTSTLSTVQPFARLYPRRVSAGATSPLLSRVGGESNRRPGCPGRYEEGTRVIVKSARLIFSRSPRPTQPASSTQVERVVRKPMRAECGSPAPLAATRERANATGIGWCQRVAGRKSHSRARIDSSFGCARASISVAEVGERRPGSEKRDPVGKRARGRGPRHSRNSSRRRPRVERRRRPAPRWQSRGAGRGPSRAFERTSRGRGFRSMEGTPGCSLGSLVHARKLRAALAALEGFVNVRTITASRGRRQGCQRLGTHTCATRRSEFALTWIRQSPRVSGRASGRPTENQRGAGTGTKR
jgi:hypothetical protein